LLKVDEIDVYNFDNALRGMRNPLNSWDKSDSYWSGNEFIIGKKDMELALKLINGGSEHCKFLRQIFVSMDITAPDYWWKEYATYKINTTENSTSTMHKITSRLLTEDDFSIDEWDDYDKQKLMELNYLILDFQKDKTNKTLWRKIIQKLPMSYNYLRTCTMNYENLRNMYHQRNTHKLQEWHDFCDVLKTLPNSKLITTK
jgi:hypothetical protein